MEVFASYLVIGLRGGSGADSSHLSIRKLNANGRTLFANEQLESVMIFEWLRSSMQLTNFLTTTCFGESSGSRALVTTRTFRSRWL